MMQLPDSHVTLVCKQTKWGTQVVAGRSWQNLDLFSQNLISEPMAFFVYVAYTHIYYNYFCALLFAE